MQSELTSTDLKAHLKNAGLPEEWLLQVHVIQRRAFLFSEMENGIQKEMEFRRDISSSIGLSINEVSLVGSAQIGYSIKPNARLQEIDAEYKKTKKKTDRSDIDVAIVSKLYFEKIQRELLDFTKGFTEKWQYTNFYPTDEELSRFDIKRADYQFYRYLAMGWIRPDFCPPDFTFGYKVSLNKWKNNLDRKISIGIYREWSCLKDYQQKAFKSLRELAIKDQL